MQDQITIFLPVETKSRELPYKSPLAFLLANLGCRVLIGRQQELRLLWFSKRNFFYLDKSCARTKYSLYRDIKRCGGGIGVFCEEGLVYRTKQQYLSERIYQKSFDLIDIFWCWGRKQFSDISEEYNESKLKIIDPPRLSITLKYKEALRAKNKKEIKVLFLTSFGRLDKRINNKKLTQLEILKKRGTYNPAIGEKFYSDWDNYLKQYQEKFINLIEKFCESFSDIKCSIRIHPSESREKYLRLVKKYPNLEFSEYLQIGDSIINSTHIISSFSTSSLEAKLINSNSYVYNPDSDKRYEPKIIKDVCNCYSSYEEIFSEVLSNKDNFKENNNLKEYISNVEIDSINILKNYANEIYNKGKSIKYKTNNISAFFIRTKYLLKHNLRNILYFLSIKKDSLVAKSKCNLITSEDIIKYGEEFLCQQDSFSRIKNNYGIKKIHNNVFEVYKY